MTLVYPGESAYTFNPGYYYGYNGYNYPQPVIQQQPRRTDGFTDERGQRKKPLRDWSTGICGCRENTKTCLLVAFCPECFGCHMASKAGETCCLPCLFPGWMISLRAHIRGKHRIKGSICNDCLMVSCCYPCAMCQLSREIDNIKTGTAPR